jgi:hypothetical protein
MILVNRERSTSLSCQVTLKKIGDENECTSTISVSSIKEKLKSFSGGVSKSQLAEVTGWFNYGGDSEYTDLMSDAFYDGTVGVGKSLDLVFSIHWGECTFSIGFGKNDGEGLDLLVNFNSDAINHDVEGLFDLATSLDKTETLKDLYTSYPKQKVDLIQKLKLLLVYLGG